MWYDVIPVNHSKLLIGRYECVVGVGVVCVAHSGLTECNQRRACMIQENMFEMLCTRKGDAVLSHSDVIDKVIVIDVYSLDDPLMFTKFLI